MTISSHPHRQLRLAYKALRLTEINDRFPVKLEKGAFKSSSIAEVAGLASMKLAEDWVRAGLTPAEWSVYRSRDVLLRSIKQIADFLHSHADLAKVHFTSAKTAIIHEILPAFYDKNGNALGIPN